MFMNALRHAAMDRGQRHKQKSCAADTRPFRNHHCSGWSRDVGFLGLIGLLGLLGWEAAAQATEPSRYATRLMPYGQLPLSFEANQGQTDDQVQFLAHGPGYTLFLTAHEAVFAFRTPAAPGLHPKRIAPKTRAGHDTPNTAPAVVRMQLLGANPAPQVVGLEEQPAKSNYFIGNDARKWRTNVPNYARVKYANVYPGVDLVYYGNPGQLEYDFVVQPGADPSRIALDIEASLVSARGSPSWAPLRVAENGDLAVGTKGSEVVFRQPVVYQPVTDSGPRTRDIVEGKYVIRAGQQVTFDIASYDKTRPLVIDPTLVYSSYLGGSGQDLGSALAVDAAGNAYVTGETSFADFPTTPEAFQPTKPGDENVFVSKLNATGSALVYSTYLGGTQSVAQRGNGITVDSAGNAYVTGFTGAPDFPTTPGAFQTTPGAVGEDQAFVTKLNPTGSALVYSTFLGGSSGDGAAAIAIDTSGNAYVTGVTLSADFPTTPGAFQPTPGDGFGRVQDAFVSKLNATGSALVYSTYLGATDTGGNGITVDAAGNAYVAGSTNSSDFSTTPGAFSSSGNAFITKLNAAGSALAYSTRLGGSVDEQSSGIAVDAAGHAYVTGQTRSPDFPTVNPLQPTLHSSGGNAFVAKLTPDGTALVYATYLGGSGTIFSGPPGPPRTSGDTGSGIAIDAAGNAYVTGNTTSSDFPITSDAFQTTFGGGFSDAFVSKLNAAGSALLYSSYLGGNDIDNGTGIGVDAASNAYVTGVTLSADFPTTPGAFQPTFGGVVDGFVAKVATIVAAAFAGTPGTPNCHGESVSALARQFGGLDAAAAALGFPTVQALQDAIREFCEE
jgi:Beta-propeller repeat